MACTEKQLESARLYREKNPKKTRDACQKWRENNREAARIAVKRWDNKNPEKRKESTRLYREANPGKTSEWARNWRVRNPEYSYKKYGLSKEGFEKLLVEQDGRCAICSLKMEKPCVDHCHKTKSVRGILCHPCNVSLGLMKDSFTNLIRAADYIRRTTFV